MQTLGVITPFMWGVFLGEIHTSLLRRARDWGFRLVMIRAGNWDQTYESRLSTALCDAWIDVLDCVGPELAAFLVGTGKPYCSLVHRPSAPGASSVRCDNAVGMTMAMEALEKQGHRRFVFLGDATNTDMVERADAFRRFHQTRGWELDESCLVLGPGASASAGWEMAATLDRQGATFTALVAANDQLAHGAMGYFQQQGRRIPQDLAIFGFDNSAVCQETNPPLSSVDQQVDTLVLSALKEVRRRLDDASQPCSQIRVTPALCLRPSSHPGLSVLQEERGAPLGDPRDQTYATLAFENEVNRIQWGRSTLENLKSLLNLLSQRGRRAQFAEVHRDECCLGGDPGQRVCLDQFGQTCLNADHPFDPLFILPCLTGAAPTHAVVVSVPVSQVLESETLGLVSHELELTAIAVERSSVREQLSLQVKERTEHLEEALRQLHFAQEDALKSERLAAVGRLAAQVAHEINTPLGAILSANSSIRSSFEDLVMDWIPFLRSLDEAGYQCLRPLLSRLNSCPERRPSEFRRLRTLWLERLSDGLPQNPELAEHLAELGLEFEEPSWAPLLQRPDRVAIFGCIGRLLDVHRSVSVVDQAATKAAETIKALHR